MIRCVLYRVFDNQGSLLYVGATANPGQRVADHQKRQPWWDEASSMTMEHFETPESLLDAEAHAIAHELPRYNIVHHPHVSAASRAAPRRSRRQRGTGTLFQRGDGYWVAGVELGYGPNGKRRFKRFVRRDKDAARIALAQFLATADQIAG